MWHDSTNVECFLNEIFPKDVGDLTWKSNILIAVLHVLPTYCIYNQLYIHVGLLCSVPDLTLVIIYAILISLGKIKHSKRNSFFSHGVVFIMQVLPCICFLRNQHTLQRFTMSMERVKMQVWFTVRCREGRTWRGVERIWTSLVKCTLDTVAIR